MWINTCVYTGIHFQRSSHDERHLDQHLKVDASSSPLSFTRSITGKFSGTFLPSEVLGSQVQYCKWLHEPPRS